jgi:exodeoxyribonuclease-5
MILTSGQESALALARRLIQSPGGSVGVWNGYAGTGKTTALGFLGQEQDIAVVTPTGKAALRVKEATGLKAQTIHMWMYAPEEDQHGNVRFRRKPLERIRRPQSGLLVIDEASMVDRTVWDELYDTCTQLGINILAIGDSFQLPPVASDGDQFSILSPDFPFHERVNMTEIVRQALDSPIILASMHIRENRIEEALALLEFCLPSKLIDRGLGLTREGGALICYKNIIRHALNSAIRTTIGLKDDGIYDNEPLLVLKNDYTLNVYNGEVITFKSWATTPTIKPVYDRYKKATFPLTLGKARIHSESIALEPEYTVTKFNQETEELNSEIVSREYGVLAVEEVFGRTEALQSIKQDTGPQSVRGMSLGGMESGASTFGFKAPHLHANFGYTLTCHKAQGSEWPEVIVVLEPRFNVFSQENRKWLYTAICRAKEKVSICHLPETSSLLRKQ